MPLTKFETDSITKLIIFSTNNTIFKSIYTNSHIYIYNATIAE